MKSKPSRKTSAGSGEQHTAPQISRRTLRVTFEYNGGEFRIANQMRVEKITPPTMTPCPDAATAAGYWVELRDRRGRCLFHRLLPDAIRDSAEIYPGKNQLARTPLRQVAGRFEVLLPDLPEADSVVIMGHPVSSEGLKQHQRARVLAKFKISKDGLAK